jgi:hypothetical protein
MVAFQFSAHNTRMPGGERAAANCRFDASVTVHSLCSGGVMSAMRQLRQCVKRCLQYVKHNEIIVGGEKTKSILKMTTTPV